MPVAPSGAEDLGAVDPASPLTVTVYLRPNAAANDVDAVKAFAAEHGLRVVGVNEAARSVKLRGSAAAVGDAFGVELHRYRVDGLVYRSYAGAVHVPEELGATVQAVLGLDNRPVARAWDT